VIVVLDAARADHFGAYGYSRDATPHFDAWAQESVVFEQAISNASYTQPAVASLFSGQPPGRHQALNFGIGLDLGAQTLAETLRDAGYRTAGFTENPLLEPAQGFSQGFETYRILTQNVAPSATAEFDVSASRDHVREAARWAESVRPSTPIFLYLHLLRPHNPYRALPEHRGRFARATRSVLSGETAELMEWQEKAHELSADDLQHLIDLYDENLFSADALAGELVEALARTGRADDTILVVTSDHGETFAEHGMLMHSYQVFEESVRIPLLVRFPPAFDIPPARIREAVQLTDLLPTLLAAAGVEPPGIGGPVGRNLLPFLQRRASAMPEGQPVITHALRQIGLREFPYQLVVPSSPLPGGQPAHLYQLELDPGEQSDRAVAEPERTAKLLVALGRAIDEQKAAGPPGRVPIMDDVHRHRLRALGYTVDEPEEAAAPPK
jgi:arylsulfatase A-like enzyme